jgi:hypothetical protein
MILPYGSESLVILNNPSIIFKDGDTVRGADGAAFKNLYKDALSGHDTIPHLFVYGTAIMAFLANLGDFHQCVFSQFQSGAHRQFPEPDAFGGNVFGKITWIDVKTLRPNFGNAFYSQETDLPVPITGMGIIFQTVIIDKFSGSDICLFDAFFKTNGHGNDPALFWIFTLFHSNPYNYYDPLPKGQFG